MVVLHTTPQARGAGMPGRSPEPTVGLDLAGPHERLPVAIYPQPADANLVVANEIAGLIRAKAKVEEPCVLGLATGSTPLGIYTELVRQHREEGLSFRNVVLFNLDEYYPMQPERLQSYVRYMHEHLVDSIDIDPNNVHIPDGTLPLDRVSAFCEFYEERIRRAGGIDLQLLGIGRSGHIGFNEPGSGQHSRTRLITLDRLTRQDAASDFFGEEHVPARAITMGVATILEARRIRLVAFGEGKAPIVARFIEQPASENIPATFLHGHADAKAVLDRAAATLLERERCPWLVRPVEWDARLKRRAVVWLAEQTGKAILKLTNEDYNEKKLQELAAHSGRSYDINVEVFRDLQAAITGWPGGKPAELKRAGDIDRPRDLIFPKRVLIMSPHPDDDVISMGGTLIRLADQGHEVHVAYQTSGNFAVFDDEALRFLDLSNELHANFTDDRLDDLTGDSQPGHQQTGHREGGALERDFAALIRDKQPGDIDPPAVRRLKSLIRRGEARAACRSCGVPKERLHFLDLPFYETGRARKNPIGEQDVALVVQVLRQVRPHQLYAAGDLADPHGTHRVCLNAVQRAIELVRQDDWFADCELLLYRGAWQEWPIHQIDIAVPLSPGELLRKRGAIFEHRSQKDRVAFRGDDEREFWQRAEERNRSTAAAFDRLGLAEYEAMEAFVRWHGEPL